MTDMIIFVEHCVSDRNIMSDWFRFILLPRFDEVGPVTHPLNRHEFFLVGLSN